MEIEKKILSVSKLKEAKLFTHALKASMEPDTGITINVKSAYHVIKDCATITVQYLAIHAYINLKDPIKELSGIFTRSDIKKFIQRTSSESHTNLLLNLMLNSIKDKNMQAPVVGPLIESDNVYGDYDNIDSSVAKNLDAENMIILAFKPLN